MKKEDLLIKKYGKLYSEELGIDLESKKKEELFKWFLASVLFGARISETIAKNTYLAFKKYGLLSPRRILKAGWRFLINPIMREGGYVRYDGKTSDEVLRNCRRLLKEYKGDLRELYKKARDSKVLEERLLEFYGVGPVTVNIFLRELRHVWRKAEPGVQEAVKKMARKYRIDLKKFDKHSKRFVRLECALFRMRKE